MSAFAETKFLKPVAQAIVPARTKPFNAALFYRHRHNLYIYNTLADSLDLKARKTVVSAPEHPYAVFLIKADVSDRDIRKALPRNHLSKPEDIAGLMEAQPRGGPGVLLGNGRANIFYVEGKGGEVFVVRVCWRSRSRKWYVNHWKLGELGNWYAGNQVLCPGLLNHALVPQPI